MKDVHTSHCCKWHGCKYSDKLCTVIRDIFKQEFPCEICEDDWENYQDGQRTVVKKDFKKWLKYFKGTIK